MAYDRLRELPRGMFGNVRCDSGDLDPTTIQSREVLLANAQVKALLAEPVELVPAPGAGFVVELVAVTAFFDWTADYTDITGDLPVRYTDADGAGLLTVAGSLLAAGGDAMMLAGVGTAQRVAKAACQDQPIVLCSSSDTEVGGGSPANVLRFRVVYRIWPTGW